MKKDHGSLRIRLQLAQKKLERVKGELKEKGARIESLREAAQTRKRGGGGQSREPEEVPKRRRYETCVQECLDGLARVVYNEVLEYALLETAELCFNWESLAPSWKNRIGSARERKKGSAFLAGGKEMVRRYPLQLASKKRP